MSFFVRFVVVLVGLLVASSPAKAQVGGAVEFNEMVQPGENLPQVNVFVGGSSGKIGWSVFSLITEGWGQTYGGPTFQPASWLSLSAGIGVETGHPTFRKAGSVWAGKNGSYVLSIQEFGSDHWQKNVASVRVAKYLNLGVLHQTYIGVGPLVEMSYNKLTLWGMYAPHDRRALLGIKRGF